MFEATLSAQLKKIFDFDKVTFDMPGESQEQEGVFIQVESSQTRVKDGRQTARVNGKIHVFAPSNKLPYGYFSKCIDAASAADKQGLFFYAFEENKGTYRNICERSLSFVYLFDSQFDPALGSITSVQFEIAES